MQSFVLDANENPFNVVQPGKRPRANAHSVLALKGGKPFLVFSVQGGDTQDQNLLQFFLNIVEFAHDGAGGDGGGQHHPATRCAIPSPTTSRFPADSRSTP